MTTEPTPAQTGVVLLLVGHGLSQPPEEADRGPLPVWALCVLITYEHGTVSMVPRAEALRRDASHTETSVERAGTALVERVRVERSTQ